MKTKKTRKSRSRISVPSGTLRRAPRPSPLFFTTQKRRKERGQSSTRARNRTQENAPAKRLGTLVQNKTLHANIHKTISSREKPTSWVAILLSTYTPCGGIIPCPVSTPCGGKKANPNLGCPPPDDATQPAPEPHPPPHHRDAHPAPHPKQESKP